VLRRFRGAWQGLRGDVREVRGAVETLRAEQNRTFEELRSTREELRLARVELGEARADLLEAAQVGIDNEAAVRRLLHTLRGEPDYAAAWTDPEPLVSIVIPTYRNWRDLEARSVPSALAQTHPNVEVVVVGDDAPPETAEAIARIGDPRVRYENLLVRGPYPEDERKRWMVAGSGPMNRAMDLARGAWIGFLNDDDALRPEHVEVLLEEARRTGAEVPYGKLIRHDPDGSTMTLGAFPPASHAFGWQLALHHRALRIFEYELHAAVFDQPGDWHRARRMLRAGARFSQVDRVTCDYYPAQLWRPV
jgi:hypothetical protein